MDSDFMNRNHPPESSPQFTRPTSKTALLVRQRRSMLEQLSCFICKGYLIDATTINECMDSFCKSCIVIHLRNSMNHSSLGTSSCPKCGLTITQRDPLDAIKPDKVLQDIIYKLVPGLYDVEMKQRRDFYRDFYNVESTREDDDDDNSCSSSIVLHGTSLTGEKFGITPLPKPFYKPSDNIDLSIEAQPSFSSATNHPSKIYLRCPAKLTVFQLKKFIAARFSIFRYDKIHLLYLNESLKDEYSLIDVAYIYDWRALEHMQLYYIIERDNETKPVKTTRNCVGSSTQTVKRVCIDPQPKFYEEKNNNDVAYSNPSGRSMRPRTEVHLPPPSSTIATKTQSSIMTLASFTRSTESNLITSVSASSTSVQTGTTHNSIMSYKQSLKTSANQADQIPASNPQLAFRIIRQEGTTYFIPKKDSTTVKPPNPGVRVDKQKSNSISTPSTNLNSTSYETTTQSTSSTINVDDMITSRHNLKVKPVYKQLVDPTKLKSPNLKKLGFTARY